MSSSSILILGALAILIAIFRGRKPAVFTPVLLVVLAVALYGALSRMIVTEERTERQQQRTIVDAIGVMMGREIAAAFPTGCTLAVVRMPEAQWVGHAHLLEVELNGLRKELDAKRYSLNIVFTPMPEAETEPPPETLTLADLRALLADAPDPDAILLQRVMLDPEIKAKPEEMPPIFLILGSDAQEWLQRGIIRAAVDLKTGAEGAAIPAGKMSPEEVFGLRFQILRP